MLFVYQADCLLFAVPRAKQPDSVGKNTHVLCAIAYCHLSQKDSILPSTFECAGSRVQLVHTPYHFAPHLGFISPTGLFVSETEKSGFSAPPSSKPRLLFGGWHLRRSPVNLRRRCSSKRNASTSTLPALKGKDGVSHGTHPSHLLAQEGGCDTEIGGWKLTDKLTCGPVSKKCEADGNRLVDTIRLVYYLSVLMPGSSQGRLQDLE